MASPQKAYKCFSITQAFLGSPLRFEPALGSQELEDLIDAYIPGTASRQDKLSEVTIEFYKYATVDINTGSLVRTYNVCVAPTPSSWTDAAFEQSPTAQSSGFSPSLHTPSPGSSANFTDSGYGTSSFTLTPPARSRNSISAVSSRGAIKKSAKKERRSTALTIETQKIPGFSIMTKDGVDVTTSAGRGTKTKEQREHAHLMRIMKACSECKRKKVRVSGHITLRPPHEGKVNANCVMFAVRSLPSSPRYRYVADFFDQQDLNPTKHIYETESTGIATIFIFRNCSVKYISARRQCHEL
ncbi:hypothetical protein F5884DRAFT_667044 [Xylogone sp. PMI_703]|nr:hypothetical protein F5884DRAFT_667044 [Xylogone sp. PMI_703]